jgi:hypothetical protein
MSSAVETEALDFSKKLVTAYQIIWCHQEHYSVLRDISKTNKECVYESQSELGDKIIFIAKRSVSEEGNMNRNTKVQELTHPCSMQKVTSHVIQFLVINSE